MIPPTPPAVSSLWAEKLGGEKFYFIVNHWPSRGAQSPVRERAGYQVRKLKEALLAQDPGARIVIMGDLNDDPNNASVDAPESLGAKHKESDVTSPDDLYNPWWDMLYNKGIGTLYYRGKWNLFDQIIFSAGLLDKSHPERLHLLTNAVFSRDYLLQQEGKYKGTPKTHHCWWCMDQWLFRPPPHADFLGKRRKIKCALPLGGSNKSRNIG